MNRTVYIPAPTRERISIMDALSLLMIGSLIVAVGYASTWEAWV